MFSFVFIRNKFIYYWIINSIQRLSQHSFHYEYNRMFSIFMSYGSECLYLCHCVWLLWDTLNMALLQVSFSRASREIHLFFNSCSILHQLNTKPNTIKSHKKTRNKIMQIQHFLSWNKANIKYSCKSQLYIHQEICYSSISSVRIKRLEDWSKKQVKKNCSLSLDK